MRLRFVLVLALAGAPARLAAQADTVPAAMMPLPVAATRAVPPDSTRPSRRAILCDRMDVMDHYTGTAAIWGGAIGAAAGLGWAIVQSQRHPEKGLVGVGDFLVGPTIGGAYGVGAGALAGLGKWGVDHARRRAWRPGPRDRARRQGLLCRAVPAPTTAPR